MTLSFGTENRPNVELAMGSISVEPSPLEKRFYVVHGILPNANLPLILAAAYLALANLVAANSSGSHSFHRFDGENT